MRCCVFMPTTFIIDCNCPLFKNNQLANNTLRIKQYKDGINQFVSLFKSNNDVDTYISDNSSYFADNYETKILFEMMGIKLLSSSANQFGGINKGSGIIENWIHHINLLLQYEYVIHFEPRLLLTSIEMIENFLNNPRNMFTHGTGDNHFNTGLFMIKTTDLLKFTVEYTPKFLVERTLGLEYAMYEFFINNYIQYDIIKKMNVIWHDVAVNKLIEM